ncbi:MAG: TPM domain-containing protein, partial [Novosphingobium sp.]|nr:TPM domain-containing protein [Novosphingobium sp.]
LIVAPNERKVRIEVGYGLEGTLTDGLSWRIINSDIVPRFKAGDMAGGIEAGADAIIAQLKLPPEEAQRIAAEADKAGDEGIPWPVIIFMLFIFLFFVLPILTSIFGGGGKRLRGGRSGPIVWSPGGFSGGSSGGFSSGGFSGGFSGGGGSFGGGGSSGSW